jgi:predicted RNase H-like HicB family nuclease
MLTQYIKAAMYEAHYELMENGRFFGSIPSCQGCWAEGATLEECRDELESTLEDWILLGVQFGHKLPVVAGIDLNPQPAYAEAD